MIKERLVNKVNYILNKVKFISRSYITLLLCFLGLRLAVVFMLLCLYLFCSCKGKATFCFFLNMRQVIMVCPFCLENKNHQFGEGEIFHDRIGAS